jgi:hypothetical protein
LHAAAGEERVASHEQSFGALAGKRGKGHIDFADRAGIDDLDLQPEGGGRFAQLPQISFGGRGIRRI